MRKRACGMLLPVASLPSDYGIGALSREAYDFVDKLQAAGQAYWQILPLGPTGYGDSPYQSFSAFAGNPYLIDLEELIKEGLLTKDECDAVDFGSNAGDIDYEKVYYGRFPLLRKAYKRWKVTHADQGMEALGAETREYCLYMAIKDRFGGVGWTEWDEDIRLRECDALASYQEELKDDIQFYGFLQLQFDRQWTALKTYANEHGVRIIGDIPIYVALDSADSWSCPELFQFDEEGRPEAVAGCPPDGFAATGQLWGNPLYRWEYHRKTGYDWWIRRMEYSLRLYDMVRVDHFRGFDEYYAIPADSPTAETGEWRKGPGAEIFETMKKRMGEVDIIAEDLGFLTPSVLKLLKDSGYPGMKVLQFAFDSDPDSMYLPHNYSSNCVVYTGTHDNETLCGWLRMMKEQDKEYALHYASGEQTPTAEQHWDFIRLALASVADLAVIPVQDYLGLGTEARINEPSTLGGNWMWRMEKDAFDEALLTRCREMAEWYGRVEHLR